MDNKMTAEQAIFDVLQELDECTYSFDGRKRMEDIRERAMKVVGAALSAPRVTAGWAPEIHCGPKTHICWTPDYVQKDQRVQMVLISLADYQTACAMLAASHEPVADSQQVIDDLRAELCKEQNRRLRAESKASYLSHKLGSESEPVWFWQGDGEDHLESLAAGVAIVIRADDLRHLVDPLRAEVEALKALESALAEFEAETEALPLGHESKSNGASTYNWRVRMVAELREKAARLRDGGA